MDNLDTVLATAGAALVTGEPHAPGVVQIGVDDIGHDREGLRVDHRHRALSWRAEGDVQVLPVGSGRYPVCGPEPSERDIQQDALAPYVEHRHGGYSLVDDVDTAHIVIDSDVAEC